MHLRSQPSAVSCHPDTPSWPQDGVLLARLAALGPAPVLRECAASWGPRTPGALWGLMDGSVFRGRIPGPPAEVPEEGSPGQGLRDKGLAVAAGLGPSP